MHAMNAPPHTSQAKRERQPTAHVQKKQKRGSGYPVNNNREAARSTSAAPLCCRVKRSYQLLSMVATLSIQSALWGIVSALGALLTLLVRWPPELLRRAGLAKWVRHLSVVSRVYGSNPTPKDFSKMNNVVNSQLPKSQKSQMQSLKLPHKIIHFFFYNTYFNGIIHPPCRQTPRRSPLTTSDHSHRVKTNGPRILRHLQRSWYGIEWIIRDGWFHLEISKRSMLVSSMESKPLFFLFNLQSMEFNNFSFVFSHTTILFPKAAADEPLQWKAKEQGWWNQRDVLLQPTQNTSLFFFPVLFFFS